MARRRLGGSFWPSEEQALLLRTCFLTDDEARRAWQEIRPRLDIQRLEFGSMALLPLLYERLLAWGTEEPFASRLKGVYRYVWYQNQVSLTALGGAIATLTDAGLEPMTHGAAALVVRHYRRLGVRPFREGEVLLCPGELDRASEALAAAGWSRALGESGRRLVFEHSVSTTGDRCAIASWLPGDVGASGRHHVRELVWRDGEAIEVQGVTALAMSPTHELLFTIVDGARTGGSRVQWIADAMAILQSSQVDWEQLHELAVLSRYVARVRDGLVYLAEEIGAAVPDSSVEQLNASAVTPRERVAHWIGGHGELFGRLPAIVESHLVSTQHQSVPRAVLGLPHRLQEEWGLSGSAALPGAIVRKSTSAVSRAQRGRRHEPLHGSPTRERNV